MKNIRSEARCTNANGRDISTEMREPFGSGMDHGREAVAIRGVSFRVPIPEPGRFQACSASAESFQGNDADNANDGKFRVLKKPCTFSVRVADEAVKGTREQLYTNFAARVSHFC